MIGKIVLPSGPRPPEASRGPVAGGRIQLVDMELTLADVLARPLTTAERGWRRLLTALGQAEPARPSASTAKLGGPGGALAVLRPGDDLSILPRWLALADPGDDYAVTFQLQDSRQHLLAQDDEWPRRGFSPTSLWRTGQATSDRYRLRLPPDAEPGRYRLLVALYTRRDLKRLIWRGGGDTHEVGFVKVAPPSASLTASDAPLYGAAIRLVEPGPLPGSIVPGGQTIELTPHWRVERALAGDLTVFVHLLDSAGRVIANGDAPPREGGYPTSLWEPGEVITDRYRVVVPRAAHAGAALAIGWYRPETGERLSLENGQDRLILARFDIAAP